MLLKVTSLVLAASLAAGPTSEPSPTADPAGADAEGEAVSDSDPAPSTAEPDPMVEARREYREGSEAYQTGRYEEAVVHFERSFELSHRVDLLYNLGQSYARWFEISDQTEHLRRARLLFKNYASSVDENTKSRIDALRRIDEIDAQLEKLESEEAEAEIAPPTANPRDKPVYKKGWFWGTIVGVVVLAAAATTAGVLISRRRNGGFEPELGTIGERGLRPGAGLGLRF